MTDALWTIMAMLGVAWLGRWSRDRSAHHPELVTLDALARFILWLVAMGLSWVLVRIILNSLFGDFAPR